MDKETQKVKEDFEKHVLSLFAKLVRQGTKGDIKQRIADILRTDTTAINKVLADNINVVEKITSMVNNEEELFEKDGTIKTTKTLKKAHNRVWRIVDDALATGDLRTALTALQIANKQIEVTMKRKGELNPELRRDELIPKDFGEFLVNEMVKGGFVEEKEEENKDATDNN